MQRLVTSDTVPFECFGEFGDPSILLMTRACVKLLFSVEHSELVDDRVTFAALVSFLSSCFQVPPIAALFTQVLLDTPPKSQQSAMLAVWKLLCDGVSSSDHVLAQQSAAAVDLWLTLLLSDSSMTPLCQAALSREPRLSSYLSSLFSTMFVLYIWEPAEKYYTFSRPLLPLLLVNTEAFIQLRSALLAPQRPDVQNTVSPIIDSLLKVCCNRAPPSFLIDRSLIQDITPSLEATNRDRFINNISNLRAQLLANCTRPIV